MVPLVEVAQQRVDSRAKRPRRLQPRRIRPLRPGAAARTSRRVLPRLDHNRPHGRQLHHLTAADPTLPSGWQRFAASLTAAGATPHDHIGRLPSPAQAIVPPTSLPSQPLRPVRLEPDRRWHRRVARRLRRLAQLRLQLGNLSAQLFDRLLLPQDDRDQRLTVKLVKPRSVHQDQQLTRTLSCVGEEIQK
jgi:hypothetical protein